MTNFLPRLITGIVYISFVAGSILYDSKIFTLVFSLLMLIALYESNELWKKIRLKNLDYNYPIPQAYVGLSMTTLILVPFFFGNSYKAGANHAFGLVYFDETNRCSFVNKSKPINKFNSGTKILSNPSNFCLRSFGIGFKFLKCI